MEEVTRSMHKLTLNNRKTAIITGVLDVIAFDLNEILLETDQGILMLKGNDLHVKKLSLEKGEVDVDGRVDSIVYSEVNGGGKEKGESVFSRLFR